MFDLSRPPRELLYRCIRYTGENGNWYSVQIKRSYKNGDDQWRDTDAMGYDDVLTAAKLLDQAHTWITEQMASDRKARKNKPRRNTRQLGRA